MADHLDPYGWSINADEAAKILRDASPRLMVVERGVRGSGRGVCREEAVSLCLGATDLRYGVVQVGYPCECVWLDRRCAIYSVKLLTDVEAIIGRRLYLTDLSNRRAPMPEHALLYVYDGMSEADADATHRMYREIEAGVFRHESMSRDTARRLLALRWNGLVHWRTDKERWAPGHDVGVWRVPRG